MSDELMKAMTGTQWVGSEHNAIIAQIEISNGEIEALGGIIERSESELGQSEAAFFHLNTLRGLSFTLARRSWLWRDRRSWLTL
jgi:hypothetical protein